MNPRRILYLLLLFMALTGATSVSLQTLTQTEGYAVQFIMMFTASFLIFAWYRFDSEQRLYRRSRLLNSAITSFAVIAVPYYMIRSRGKGQRVKAFGKFLGFAALMLVAMLLGGISMAFLDGNQ